MSPPAAVRALVVSGGHPFQREPFDEMLANLDGVTCEHVPRPAGAARLSSSGLGDADVVVLYDLPGIEFRRDGRLPALVPPTEDEKAGYESLLATGVPIVALHHALASWPTWPAFADLVGGRFHYVAGELHGTAYPDSGYRFNVQQHLTVVDADHPVTAGLDGGFTIIDETYCCPVFDDTVVALLHTDADLSDATHWSTTLAVTGSLEDRTGWHHPAGTPLAAWAKAAGRSPLVYLQPGDGPTAYSHPGYRRLLGNAIRWVASPAARAWAREQGATLR